MKYFLIVVLLLLDSCSKSELNQATSTKISNTKSEQEIFVTNFYRDYLSHKFKGDEAEKTLFSKEILDLQEQDHQFCKKLEPRIGSYCGYDVDGDLILYAQESDDQLTFENSQFNAKQISLNTIEVNFNLFPKPATQSFDRTIRIELVKENGTWKAKDLLYKSLDKSTFESLQAEFHKDLDKLISNEKDINTIIFEVKRAFKYGSIDSLNAYFANILTICSDKKCSNSRDQIKPFEDLIKNKRATYFKEKGNEWIEVKNLFKSIPKIENPTEHQQVELNGFTLEFIDQLWYATKINLDVIQ